MALRSGRGFRVILTHRPCQLAPATVVEVAGTADSLAPATNNARTLPSRSGHQVHRIRLSTAMRNAKSERSVIVTLAAGTETETGTIENAAAATSITLLRLEAIAIIPAPVDTIALAGTGMMETRTTIRSATLARLGHLATTPSRTEGSAPNDRGLRSRMRMIPTVPTPMRILNPMQTRLDVIVVITDPAVPVNTVDATQKSDTGAVVIALNHQLAPTPNMKQKTPPLLVMTRPPPTPTRTSKSVPRCPPSPSTASPSIHALTVAHCCREKVRPWHPTFKTANVSHDEERSA